MRERTELAILFGLTVAALAVAWFIATAEPARAQGFGPSAVTGSNASNTCTNTASQILGINTRRRATLFVAASSNVNTAYLGFSSGVTTVTGIPLLPGTTFADDSYIGAWFCITAAGNATVTAHESAR